MALTQEIKEARQIKIGINSANSGTFKTAAADSATYTALACATMTIDYDFSDKVIPSNSGSRNQVHFNKITNEKGSMPKFNIDKPFSVYEDDYILYSWFQKVVEGVASPFTKVFTPFTTHPIFSSNEGHFVTVIKGFPLAGTSHKMTSCIVSDFTLKCDRDADDGFLMIDSNWTSATGVDKTSTAYADATFERGLKGVGGASSASDDYGMLDFTDISAVYLDFDATASPIDDRISLKSFSINATHEIEGIDPDGSGGYENFGISKREMGIEIELLKDSQLEQALVNVAGNTGCKFTVRFGNATATATVEGDVEIIATFKIDGDGIEIIEDGIIGAKIKGTISMENDLATEPLTINMANIVDRAW